MEPVEWSKFVDNSFVALPAQLKAIEEALNVSNSLNVKAKLEINISQISYAIKMEIRSGTALNLNDYFEHMIKLNTEHESSLKLIIQVIYPIVGECSRNECMKGSNLIFTAGWAELLIDALFSNTWDKTTISDVLLCLKLYSKTFCEIDIVRRLWHTLLKNFPKSDIITITAMYVLIQFFDEFFEVIDALEVNRNVEKFVYKLLLSDGREEWKAAVYLMKKLNSNADFKVKSFWISYITVLENLKENQSHLILPSLECLKQNHLKTIKLKLWLDILYIKILSHQNILVIRWALVYILENFTCADLSPSVLLQFIKASNHTSLYNCESYFLPTENIHKFLNAGLHRFVESLSEVHLKSVPLHFWLTNIRICKSILPIYSYELILKIAARIRPLQNQFIRLKSIELFEDIFFEAICRMQMSEFVVMVESLYNVTDPFNHFEIFYLKLVKCFENGDRLSLTQRFYEIVTNNLRGELTFIHPNLEWSVHAPNDIKEQSSLAQSNLLDSIADRLKYVKKSDIEDLIWIALMLVFESENSEIVRNICQIFWDLNLDDLIGIPFEALMREITSKIKCGVDKTAFVRKKLTDLFVKEYLTKFSDLYNFTVKAEDILNTGSHKTLLKLSQLLANNAEEVDMSTFHAFLVVLKRCYRMPSLCYIVTTNLLKYLKSLYSSNQLEDYVNQILCIDFENVGICAAVLSSGVVLNKETYIKGIMTGDANFGDARTEELYLFKIDTTHCLRLQQIRLRYALSVPFGYTNTILNELLDIYKTLSIKKPRYFENSMEHRLKMRIANAIFLKIQSNTEFWNEDLLLLVLKYNNQPNVNYMLELLVAKCAPDDKFILDKLNEVTGYTPSQQVSLISIVHCYSVLNKHTISKEFRDVMVNKLLPLTMGAHFQTRLYAQLVIYDNLDKSNASINDEPLLPNHINIKEGIASAIGPRLNELLNDVRFLLPYIYLSNPTDFYDILMFITMAPAEEYLSSMDYSRYEASRCIFSKKRSSSAKEIPTSSSNLTNMQRKMNPENDICAVSSLMRSETAAESEMFVVASLIDKIPNLGGIARTCEVLGIQNLVLSSILLVEKEDFRSVSMTAEKNLNITEVRPSRLQEFFKEKQADGFKIVGAEQTVDSVNIIGFEFPRKCILVLGHEKEGIPSNILGFLDYAIEIPQFGVLRSLNVHVTGALFMWEYCKQHIVENSLTTTP
ncbi:uncharacterized protein LOC129240907 isoform X1 [Anastrepha obliqua]|uniref:uncharacterized protein LOC129240907 isoform X1 n=2 Tax=Anastrepha obliqua TaxID=95512 RepID=UPI0024099526|nr:uncharacterized protein LOC129240907 isoform X1 [Anastrepha obliqua]